MSLVADARAYAVIGRWLGPWAKHGGRPENIRQHDDILPPTATDSRPVRVRVYHPNGKPRATFMVAPGLHYEGADDPRQDRFCRVLASAGNLVLAPILSDFIDLVPSPRVIDDFVRVWEARGQWDPDLRPPVVFSISFGSLAAIGLAARVGAAGVDRLVLFGGYADFPGMLRFSLTGEVAGRNYLVRDPINQPVVFMSMIPYLDEPCVDPAPVMAGWRQFVQRTWGRPEMKALDRYRPIALEIAETIPANVRELFLHGVGLTPNWLEVAMGAAVRGVAGQHVLSATPFLADVRCRVDIVHGRADDVIPYEQAYELQAGMINADVRVHLTGLYDHSGGARPKLGEAAREALTMIKIMGTLART